MSASGGKYQKAGQACQPAGLSVVDRLLAAILPWTCVLCRQPATGMDLCIDCLNDLVWTGPSCRHCATPLVGTGSENCGSCQKDPVLDHCLAALAYEYPVPQLVAALKYRRRSVNARVLGELLAIRVCEGVNSGELNLPDALVPVPLHPWRQLRRGYNQAELIAKVVGRELGIPVDSRLVKRARNTPAQTGLSRSARRRNLRGCFRLRRTCIYESVAVIDDVATTRSTVKEIAKLFHREKVSPQAWIVARA